MADEKYVLPEESAWKKISDAVHKINHVSGALSSGPRSLAIAPPTRPTRGVLTLAKDWFVAKITDEGFTEQTITAEGTLEDNDMGRNETACEPAASESTEVKAYELNGNDAPVDAYVIMYELPGPVFCYQYEGIQAYQGASADPDDAELISSRVTYLNISKEFDTSEVLEWVEEENDIGTDEEPNVVTMLSLKFKLPPSGRTYLCAEQTGGSATVFWNRLEARDD